MTSRSFEREVRNVIVGGLVTLLFLAGTAAVVLRNTTEWGVAETGRRLARETRTAAAAFAATADASRALVDDVGPGRVLGENGARSAALYDAHGTRVADAPYLPGAGEAPDGLDAADLTAGVALVRDGPAGQTVIAQDDRMLFKVVEGLYADWSNADRPAELHIFARGGHGFGMVRQGLPVDRWIDLLGDWLADQGLA